MGDVLEELREAVKANPFITIHHTNLAAALLELSKVSPESIDDFLAACASMQRYVVVPEPLLLVYLAHCEARLEADEVEQRYSQAFAQLPASVPIWTQYLRFRIAAYHRLVEELDEKAALVKGEGEDQEQVEELRSMRLSLQKVVRDSFEEAIEACGSDFVRGGEIWDLYIQFENDVLEECAEDLLESDEEASDDEQGSSRRKRQKSERAEIAQDVQVGYMIELQKYRILSLLARRLTLPLEGNDQVFPLYSKTRRTLQQSLARRERDVKKGKDNRTGTDKLPSINIVPAAAALSPREKKRYNRMCAVKQTLQKWQDSIVFAQQQRQELEQQNGGVSTQTSDVEAISELSRTWDQWSRSSGGELSAWSQYIDFVDNWAACGASEERTKEVELTEDLQDIAEYLDDLNESDEVSEDDDAKDDSEVDEGERAYRKLRKFLSKELEMWSKESAYVESLWDRVYTREEDQDEESKHRLSKQLRIGSTASSRARRPLAVTLRERALTVCGRPWGEPAEETAVMWMLHATRMSEFDNDSGLSVLARATKFCPRSCGLWAFYFAQLARHLENASVSNKGETGEHEQSSRSTYLIEVWDKVFGALNTFTELCFVVDSEKEFAGLDGIYLLLSLHQLTEVVRLIKDGSSELLHDRQEELEAVWSVIFPGLFQLICNATEGDSVPEVRANFNRLIVKTILASLLSPNYSTTTSSLLLSPRLGLGFPKAWSSLLHDALPIALPALGAVYSASARAELATFPMAYPQQMTSLDVLYKWLAATISLTHCLLPHVRCICEKDPTYPEVWRAQVTQLQWKTIAYTRRAVKLDLESRRSQYLQYFYAVLPTVLEVGNPGDQTELPDFGSSFVFQEIADSDQFNASIPAEIAGTDMRKVILQTAAHLEVNYQLKPPTISVVTPAIQASISWAVLACGGHPRDLERDMALQMMAFGSDAVRSTLARLKRDLVNQVFVPLIESGLPLPTHPSNVPSRLQQMYYTQYLMSFQCYVPNCISVAESIKTYETLAHYLSGSKTDRITVSVDTSSPLWEDVFQDVDRSELEALESLDYTEILDNLQRQGELGLLEDASVDLKQVSTKSLQRVQQRLRQREFSRQQANQRKKQPPQQERQSKTRERATPTHERVEFGKRGRTEDSQEVKVEGTSSGSSHSVQLDTEQQSKRVRMTASRRRTNIDLSDLAVGANDSQDDKGDSDEMKAGGDVSTTQDQAVVPGPSEAADESKRNHVEDQQVHFEDDDSRSHSHHHTTKRENLIKYIQETARRTVFVQNLPLHMNEFHLRGLFEGQTRGKVESMHIPQRRVQNENGEWTSIGKGYAYVVMSSEEEAKRAIDYIDGFVYAQKALKVSMYDMSRMHDGSTQRSSHDDAATAQNKRVRGGESREPQSRHERSHEVKAELPVDRLFMSRLPVVAFAPDESIDDDKATQRAEFIWKQYHDQLLEFIRPVVARWIEANATQLQLSAFEREMIHLPRNPETRLPRPFCFVNVPQGSAEYTIRELHQKPFSVNIKAEPDSRPLQLTSVVKVVPNTQPKPEAPSDAPRRHQSPKETYETSAESKMTAEPTGQKRVPRALQIRQSPLPPPVAQSRDDSREASSSQDAQSRPGSTSARASILSLRRGRAPTNALSSFPVAVTIRPKAASESETGSAQNKSEQSEGK